MMFVYTWEEVAWLVDDSFRTQSRVKFGFIWKKLQDEVFLSSIRGKRCGRHSIS